MQAMLPEDFPFTQFDLTHYIRYWVLVLRLQNVARTTSLCSFTFMILRDHAVYVVYILKLNSSYALEGVSNVAYFITIDEQFNKTEAAIFAMQAML